MKEKKFNLLEFVVHFLFGAVLGAPVGFCIWAASVRGELMHGCNCLINTYPAAYLFIGGGAFLGGIFFALYKGPRGYW
jgi:hypothetical protein